MFDKISIIIPVYNAETDIERCLDSILKQTYTDYEVILVDDGSRDSSGSICDSYSSRYDHIRCIHQPNSGVSEARNRGLGAVTGKYVTFIDSDDYVTPDYLEQLVEAAHQTSAELIQGGFRRIYYDGSSEPESIKCVQTPVVTSLKSDYLKYLRGFIWSKLFLNSVIKEHDLHFDKSLTLSEDLCFILEYVTYINKVAFIPTDGYCYCISPSSASSRFHQPEALMALWKKETMLLNRLKPGETEPQDRYMAWKSSVGEYIFSWILNQIIINNDNRWFADTVTLLKEQHDNYAETLRYYNPRSRIKKHIMTAIMNRKFRYAVTLLTILSHLKKN